ATSISATATTANAPHLAPPIVHQTLQSPGQPLDRGTRSFMGSRFGADFGSVRVHTSEQAAASARAVDASAYTVGHHVVFGAGSLRRTRPRANGSWRTNWRMLCSR